jgi:sugar phosphate isomerase/epimerase
MRTSVVVADASFQGVTAPLIGSWEEVLRQASEIGFDAVQLTVNRPVDVPVKRLLMGLRQYGLVVSSIATGLGYTLDGLSLGNADEEKRLAAARRMKEHISLAARLGGAKVIIGAIRGRASDSGSLDIFDGQFRKSLDELLFDAEQKCIDLTLEASDRYETDFCISVEETARFIKSYDSPRLRLQLDTMHMLYENQDTCKEILKYGHLLAQVDISDENRMTPDGKHFNFPLLIEALLQIRYKGFLVFEYRPHPGGNSAKTGFDYICGLLRQSTEL